MKARIPPQFIDLVATPDNPVPEGLTAREVVAKDGVGLRAAHLRGSGGKGTVVIVCGRGDFIERYFETINDLALRGYGVAIFDFRDQGGSARRNRNIYRDRIRRFREYDADLAAVMNQMVLPDCLPPYHALGHSTGGLIVLRALKRRIWFERAILSAPLLGLRRGGWPRFAVRVLPTLMTALGLGSLFVPGQARRPLRAEDFPDNNLTGDKRRFLRSTEILEKEPRLGLGGATFGWVAAALDALRDVGSLRKSGALRIPVLIVSAGRDRVVDTGAARQFANGSERIAFVSIAEARHDLLSEVSEVREQFLAAFDSFLEASPGSQA
ncbi:MAG: alpha/beta hydrolase [Rhizobiales bacterium]|nr:alpha/beta hydrolase [Hyphomicrobiales bacterium]